MKRSFLVMGAFALLSFFVSSTLFAHGLMEEPASRNQFCGVITQPHEVENGDAEYPICGEAFAEDFSGGYNFMSVLTHTTGRSGVTPLPEHVCGFGSETWQGGPTPWDTPIDWPTNSMTSGRNEIVWQISWGPHFDDSEEFRYWITKPNFEFRVGEALTWDDFDTEPFCVLGYDDSNPDANPNVVPDREATRFHTFCDVPDRAGRHVIYGEWGRNFFTFERFHGCIDAVFDGSGSNVDAKIRVEPEVTEIVGRGSIELDGSSSEGENLAYQWSVSAADLSLYTLSDPTGSSTRLFFEEPAVANDVSVTLTVSDGQDSDSATVVLDHLPDDPTALRLLGALTLEPVELEPDDQVSLRAVLDDGQDLFYPPSPLVITPATAAADVWPVALARVVNTSTSPVLIGVLNGDGHVVPVADAIANNVYSRITSNVVSAFLTVTTGPTNCEYTITSEWDTGFTGSIRIDNGRDTPIEGWEVVWQYSDGTTVDSAWSAELAGENPYTATNLEWNATIPPDGSVEFGFSGTKAGGTTEIPMLEGSVCD